MDIYYFCIRILLKYLFYFIILNWVNFSNNCFFLVFWKWIVVLLFLLIFFIFIILFILKCLCFIICFVCIFIDKFFVVDGFEIVFGLILVKLCGILG